MTLINPTYALLILDEHIGIYGESAEEVSPEKAELYAEFVEDLKLIKTALKPYEPSQKIEERLRQADMEEARKRCAGCSVSFTPIEQRHIVGGYIAQYYHTGECWSDYWKDKANGEH